MSECYSEGCVVHHEQTVVPNMPDSIKGKRLEAESLRRWAQRLLDDARALDAASDAQQQEQEVLP